MGRNKVFVIIVVQSFNGNHLPDYFFSINLYFPVTEYRSYPYGGTPDSEHVDASFHGVRRSAHVKNDIGTIMTEFIPDDLNSRLIALY